MLRICGVHDALSAQVASQNGFNALWASGLGISSVLGFPDKNIATMTEVGLIVSGIIRKTNLPVFVDCDTGFGDTNNAIRAARYFKKLGATGICIEDKKFPKRNSFSKDSSDICVTVEEFCDKISKVKASNNDPGFKIIGRCESLIAGLPVEEALERSHKYLSAGADYIFIHSKSSTPNEIISFIDRWDDPRKLIICPTTYTNIDEEYLIKKKLGGIIFANQLIRSAVKSMRQYSCQLSAHNSLPDVDNSIMSLKDFLSLSGNL